MRDTPFPHTGFPPVLLHDLLARAATLWPDAVALTFGDHGLTYRDLQAQVATVAGQLLRHGLARGARVAVYLDKRFEAVVASFAATAAGGVLVPVNPVLKPGQVGHILQDAGAQVLVTSAARLPVLRDELAQCPDLRLVVVCDDAAGGNELADWPDALQRVAWAQMMAPGDAALPPLAARICETDTAAIFYTSGSTGLPKGVVLSHRNLVAGAGSVASYLENRADDVLLAVLPLSFDAGFSQLTTGFLVGARVVLLNHLFAADVLKAMAREGVTGITAVPPLYMQLAALDWPTGVTERLRYFACTGGPRWTDGLTRWGVRFRMWRFWCCAKTAASVRWTSRVSWCIAGRWWHRATGAGQRRRRRVSSHCLLRCHPGVRVWRSLSWRCFRATRCAATPRGFCISWVGATR